MRPPLGKADRRAGRDVPAWTGGRTTVEGPLTEARGKGRATRRPAIREAGAAGPGRPMAGAEGTAAGGPGVRMAARRAGTASRRRRSVRGRVGRDRRSAGHGRAGRC